MEDLKGFKLVLNDGSMEDFSNGIIIIEDENGLMFDAVNIAPQRQLLYTAMVLVELLDEYVDEDSADIFRGGIITLINMIQNKTPEGAITQ